jgi:hypothetical protein
MGSETSGSFFVNGYTPPDLVTQANAILAEMTAEAAAALASQNAAAVSATAASTSASGAASSQTAAASSASAAATSATNASTYATAAANSASAAAASLAAFEDVYLGASASAPTTNFQGGAIVAGNWYFNTTLSQAQIWSGSAWIAVASAAFGVSSFNGRVGAVSPASGDYNFSQLTGTITNAQMPAPTLSALGGVKAISPVASNWINSISTSGVPSLSQPSFSDLAGTIAAAQANSTSFTFTAAEVFANFAYCTFNTATYPITTNWGLALSWNHTQGQGESNFWNTYTGATNSFTWYQMTGTSAAKLLMSLTPAGQLQLASSLLLNGSTSGSLTLSAPAVAGGSSIVFPVGNTDFTTTGGSGQVVKQSSVGAALTVGQLAFSNITGSVAASQLPYPTTSALGGIQAVSYQPNQWVQYVDTSGVPHLAQPTFANLSGTVAATQLPNPTTSALGGVQAVNAVANQWVSSINTSGVPQLSQPGFSNLSGTASFAQLGCIAASGNIAANTASVVPSVNDIWNDAAVKTLTDAATVTPDFSTAWNFQWTIGATGRTLANPTNMKVGQTGTIQVVQNTGGGFTITSWGSYYKFPGGTKPTLSTAAGATDVISYQVVSSTMILCFFSQGMA